MSCSSLPANVRDFITRFNEYEPPRDRIAPLGRIALITSGGTSVPLEQNCVRSIENFSTGVTGCRIAESLSDSNYHIIFLTRANAKRPFVNLVDLDKILSGERVDDELANRYRKYKQNSVEVDFTTLDEYVTLLRDISYALKPVERKAMIILCAAVSDFYLPRSSMPLNKIRGEDVSAGTLVLNLEKADKSVIRQIREMCRSAFLVSFKLETEDKHMLPDVEKAFINYECNAIVGNVLATRYTSLLVFSAEDSSRWPEDKGDECLKISGTPELTGTNIIGKGFRHADLGGALHRLFTYHVENMSNIKN